MNMSEELKPCPFCGCEGVTDKVKISGQPHPGIGYVGCPECKVFIDYVRGRSDLAIKAWNRRAYE